MPTLALHVPPIRQIHRLREPVSLRRLFPTASFVGCGDIRVYDATEHSDDCQAGMLFAAKRGHAHDGSRFARDAVQRGATALLLSRPIADLAAPQCIVPDVARAFGTVCANLAGRPMRAVRTAGVTGTNGKTTVTWLVRSLLRSVGRECGLLGTIEYSDGVAAQPSSLTTPDTKTYWDWFASMAQRGTPHAAVELSSHALHQDRAAGSELEVGIVTNITHDHLDYHETIPNYVASKAKILSLIRPGGTAVFNQDDPFVDALRSSVPAGIDVMTFGLCRRAAVTAENIQPSRDGLTFCLSLRGERVEIATRLHGRHNVANCLAAAAVAEQFGLSAEEIANGLSQAFPPPGRMERIGPHTDTPVLVDYAHTPDALQHAIETVRSMTSRRVIVVFGAGGDRDSSKRPLLGAAASAADVAIVTSDNPRSEDPLQIIAEIASGFSGNASRLIIESDRAKAIEFAVSTAEPGDIVLIAGKGHETTQQIGDRFLPFDDRAVASAALTARIASFSSGRIAA
jgi:UDP-N-acetylmuramoyl-L-alanyl-D-glutamate--2,6-diaminopimelate ligase